MHLSMLVSSPGPLKLLAIDLPEVRGYSPQSDVRILRARHNIGRRNYALTWSTYTDNQTYMDSQMMELYKLSVMLLLISAP